MTKAYRETKPDVGEAPKLFHKMQMSSHYYLVLLSDVSKDLKTETVGSGTNGEMKYIKSRIRKCINVTSDTQRPTGR